MRIQAEFVIVDSRTILTNAQIVVERGRIKELCETPELQPDLLLENCVVLPGLINSHTHLEFSDLKSPLPAGNSFPDWIASVVQRRTDMTSKLSREELLARRCEAIRAGYQECQSYGTALLLDIVTEPWDPRWLNSISGNQNDERDALTQVIALTEILGLNSDRLEYSAAWARDLVDGEKRSRLPSPYLDFGLSPHATYSLLYPQIDQILESFPHQQLVAMHLAESKEEREWLEGSNGPFKDLFEQWGLEVRQKPMQITEAIEILSTFDRSLLVHGNYLSPQELDAVSRSSMAVVYCPRTHSHFAHKPYPLHEILVRDIPLLLGTDSKASNPDLSIWLECKKAVECHSNWSCANAFDTITNSAARFLRVEKNLGSLDVGKLAWLNTMQLPPHATKRNVLELLLAKNNLHSPQPLSLTKLKH